MSDKNFFKAAIILALFSTLILTFSGCEDFGQFPTPTITPQTPQPTVAPTTISSADRAILAVYEHLLSEAESPEAKQYLAEFYTVCDNWTAESERFKDGSSVWHVRVDMTGTEKWEWRPYWQQASWFVDQSGKVIPSSRFNANALRIEADLQELGVKQQQ